MKIADNEKTTIRTSRDTYEKVKDAKKHMCFSPLFRVTAVFVKMNILASSAEDIRGASLKGSFSFDRKLFLLKSGPIDAK